jgi:hypothetical protein
LAVRLLMIVIGRSPGSAEAVVQEWNGRRTPVMLDQVTWRSEHTTNAITDCGERFDS